MSSVLPVLTVLEVDLLVVVLAVSQELIGRRLRAIAADLAQAASLVGAVERELGDAATATAGLDGVLEDTAATLERLGERAESLAGGRPG